MKRIEVPRTSGRLSHTDVKVAVPRVTRYPATVLCAPPAIQQKLAPGDCIHDAHQLWPDCRD
jgi:hypothetical protein